MREPEPNDQENVPALVADLSVRGVWQPQATTFFDVQVVDSDANSYCIVMWVQVLSSIEHTKKQKYSQAAEIINASFVVTADGALGMRQRHLADKIAAIWHKSHSEVLGYLRATMLLLSFELQICAFVAVE